MNYLSGAFRYVARGEGDSQNSLSRLVDRVKTSALPRDRRSAISQLTEAAKSSPNRQVEVGELSIKLLYAVLEQDAEYDDTIKAAVELLIALCGTLDPPIQQDQTAEKGTTQSSTSTRTEFEQASARAASTNVDVFLGLPNALSLILQYLEHPDFYVKFSTIELLSAMAANSRHTLQMAMLEAAEGVPRVCRLLDDAHSHIRSNAVLLLSSLCDQSPEICKIVVFAGALEKLFALVDTDDSGKPENAADDGDDDEDSLEGFIVVQDTLLAVRSLIKGSETSKSFFRDTGCLHKLVGLLDKTAADAGMSLRADESSAVKNVDGLQQAIRKQARKNLIIAMNCIIGLVSGNAEESGLVKNDLFTTHLLNALAHAAFCVPRRSDQTLPEHLITARVIALRAIAALARDHDTFREALGSEMPETGLQANPNCILGAMMHAMLKDDSAAVRFAAYFALRDAFTVDAGLGLPSSRLLDAMADDSAAGDMSYGGNEDSSRRPAPLGNGIVTSAQSTKAIARVLKDVLLGWPSSSDAAGTFYAARFISWILQGANGARERLLGHHNDRNALLSKMMRVVARLERENGPLEARISLLATLCVWLHGSSVAVSSFLSSAMHLPMLVEILSEKGSLKDVAEIHTRGLSAVLLGICLQEVDSKHDSPQTNDGFANQNAPSITLRRGALIDVIRNRIGVTTFTACLDDLRATKSFAAKNSSLSPWKFMEDLMSIEEKNGPLSSNGSIGHQDWYADELRNIVDVVYASVAEKALDLVASANPVSVSLANDGSVRMNGQIANHLAQSSGKLALSDSAHEEVIVSYKEFIRNQDETLNASRLQIQELSSALRQAQEELDTRANFSPADREAGGAAHEREALKAEKEALEHLLEEKTADFTALSQAFATLEEEHAATTNDGDASEREAKSGDSQRLQVLRAQNETLNSEIQSETNKNEELTKQIRNLNDVLMSKDVELRMLASERDSLQVNAPPDVVESLQWRTRAEVAESKMESRQEHIDSYQQGYAELKDQIREIKRTKEDALASVSSLTERLESTQAEFETLRATRKRELQVARQASAASEASSMTEIASLRNELEEVKRKLGEEVSKKAAGPRKAQIQGYERLNSEYEAILSAYENIKAELTDSKHAAVQWQKRAERSEATMERESTENRRTSDHVRRFEGQLKAANDALAVQIQTSETSAARAAELEQQCREIDEIRRNMEEELGLMKEQLASRTEQTIRLSGQLYEVEESKNKLEEELSALQETPEQRIGRTVSPLSDEQPIDGQGGNEALQEKLAQLERELEAAKDALADSKDRESLSEARARDRDEAVARAGSLEEETAGIREEKQRLDSEVAGMKERLLLLDEAEEAKRLLTAQVVALQESLVASPEQYSTFSETNARGSDVGKVQAELQRLQTLSDEKDLRLEGLEASLNLALNRAEIAEKEKNDAMKQVAEMETMLSVLQSERTGFAEEKEALQEKIENLSSAQRSVETDRSHGRELQEKLAKAEEMRDALSKEFGSLLEACKLSESELKALKDDHSNLNQKFASSQDQIWTLTEESTRLDVAREVSHFVQTVLNTVSLSSQREFNNSIVEGLESERDQALHSSRCSLNELQMAREELKRIPSLIKQRDAALVEKDGHLARLTSLSDELRGLQAIAAERDELSSLLHDANSMIKTLSVGEANATSNEGGDKTGAEMPSTASIEKRVRELEDALRDAAKTVSVTNSELIAAQSLLVEISADKTIMRTELEAAQHRIGELEKQSRNGSRSDQVHPALSEVSEQEQSVGEHPSPNSDCANESKEEAMQVEASNLRLALERSIMEADAAADLLLKIESRIAEFERKLSESQKSVTSSCQSADIAREELQSRKGLYDAEKKSLQLELEKQEAEYQDMKRKLELSEQSWRDKLSEADASLSLERNTLRKEITDLKGIERALKTECMSMRQELDSSKQRVGEVQWRAKELEETNGNLTTEIETLEDTRKRMQLELQSLRTSEDDLKFSVQEKDTELESRERAYEQARQRTEKDHEVEVRDLEDEIDRSSRALEATERGFRDVESRLREEIAHERAIVCDTTENLKESQGFREKLEADLHHMRKEKQKSEEAMKDLLSAKEKELSACKDSLEDKANALVVLTKDRDDIGAALRAAELRLSRAQADLKDESAQRAMLESENQDFLSAVESLEGDCKRIQGESSAKALKLQSTEERLRDVESELHERKKEADGLRITLKEKETDLVNLTVQKTGSDRLNEELVVKLKSTEANRDRLMQDNKDLLAWASDLERQATELQSAASDFQEVEQNLRESLESQRFASDQNSKLVEELRSEKVAVASMQSQIGQALREKQAAESERDSSQRRADELDARIRQIREENLLKFAKSEEAMRAKAKQCAELETALAASDRKVAELETVSDELFGTTATLKQRDEDIRGLRARAVSAEQAVKALREDLQSAQSEASEIRATSSREAQQSLEAEHNELLVYLADLELEVTNLKEELGRG